MSDAGLDLRLEWDQFYQGLLDGDDTKDWVYGARFDAQVRLDLAKLGLWNGFSFTAEGALNYGNSINGAGGAIVPVNVRLFFPGIDGSDASDLLAFYFTQNLGDLVTIRVGRFNGLEFSRARPLVGGGGIDTFWNSGLAAPVTGIFVPTLVGAQALLNTRPVNFSLTVFDPLNATNRSVGSPFAEGVSILATATLSTTIAGRTGYYGIKGIYSTKDRPDLSQIIPPSGAAGLLTKKGAWFASISVQQYIIQDADDPSVGWGVFGELAKANSESNPVDWFGYFGVGGSGLFPLRPEDRFGVGYFYYGLSPNLKESVVRFANLEDESGLEVFYNLSLTPWLRVSADVQFVDPASGNFGDLIVGGIATSVRF